MHGKRWTLSEWTRANQWADKCIAEFSSGSPLQHPMVSWHPDSNVLPPHLAQKAGVTPGASCSYCHHFSTAWTLAGYCHWPGRNYGDEESDVLLEQQHCFLGRKRGKGSGQRGSRELLHISTTWPPAVPHLASPTGVCLACCLESWGRPKKGCFLSLKLVRRDP